MDEMVTHETNEAVPPLESLSGGSHCAAKTLGMYADVLRKHGIWPKRPGFIGTNLQSLIRGKRRIRHDRHTDRRYHRPDDPRRSHNVRTRSWQKPPSTPNPKRLWEEESRSSSTAALSPGLEDWGSMHSYRKACLARNRNRKARRRSGSPGWKGLLTRTVPSSSSTFHLGSLTMRFSRQSTVSAECTKPTSTLRSLRKATSWRLVS
jgi:hypothetical protein